MSSKRRKPWNPLQIWPVVWSQSSFSKSQDTVVVIIYWIFVFKMVAWACFFDQIATPITTELLENPSPCICYSKVVLASFPAYIGGKDALRNGFFGWEERHFSCGFWLEYRIIYGHSAFQELFRMESEPEMLFGIGQGKVDALFRPHTGKGERSHGSIPSHQRSQGI